MSVPNEPSYSIDRRWIGCFRTERPGRCIVCEYVLFADSICNEKLVAAEHGCPTPTEEQLFAVMEQRP